MDAKALRTKAASWPCLGGVGLSVPAPPLSSSLVELRRMTGGIPKSREAFAVSFSEWCSREDSNLHRSPYKILNLARLPIPPREHETFCSRTWNIHGLVHFSRGILRR